MSLRRVTESTAKEFLNTFKVGSRLGVPKFDQWIIRNRYVVRPSSAVKSSPVWRAFVQDRNTFRYKLNVAARKLPAEQRFVVELSGGLLEVRTFVTAVRKNRVAPRTSSFVRTQKRRIRIQMEGVDWKAVPPWLQLLVFGIFERLERFENNTIRESRQLIQEVQNFTTQLNKLKEGQKQDLLPSPRFDGDDEAIQ